MVLFFALFNPQSESLELMEKHKTYTNLRMNDENINYIVIDHLRFIP